MYLLWRIHYLLGSFNRIIGYIEYFSISVIPCEQYIVEAFH